MNQKNHKVIAPIIITILFCAYFFFIAFFVMQDTSLSTLTKTLLVIVPLGMMGVNIYVLTERIHEIRSGEEDDLSQY